MAKPTYEELLAACRSAHSYNGAGGPSYTEMKAALTDVIARADAPDAPERWYVNDTSTDTSDHGASVECLTIGPYKDDNGDAFAFSLNFADGIPDEITRKFHMMAAAPLLKATLAELASASLHHADFCPVEHNGNCVCKGQDMHEKVQEALAASEWGGR